MFYINFLELIIRKRAQIWEYPGKEMKLEKTNLKWVSYQIQIKNYNICKEKHTKISILNYIYFCYINDNNSIYKIWVYYFGPFKLFDQDPPLVIFYL